MSTVSADTTLGQQPIQVDKADDDDLVMWSVTTIIGALDKPALMYWTGEETARAAINQQATWRGMLADCDTDCTHTSARDCAAVKWLRDARFRRPKDLLSASDLGNTIHTLCEEYALTGTRPDTDRIGAEVRTRGGNTVKVGLEVPVLSAMLDRFDRWLNRAQPTYQATEVMVASPTYGYAGTADAFLTIDGFRAIADYKSSREPYDSQGNPKTPYAEVAPQLAAYRYAELAAVWRPRRVDRFRRRYYLLNESERAMAQPVPEVDGGICIHITPESCEAYPVRCNRSMHQQFLFIQEAARYVFETSKTAIGQPLEFPARSTP